MLRTDTLRQQLIPNGVMDMVLDLIQAVEVMNEVINCSRTERILSRLRENIEEIRDGKRADTKQSNSAGGGTR